MRFSICVALVVTVLSALTACARHTVDGPSLTGAVTASALRAAPTALTEAGSGRFEIHVAIDGPGSSGDVTTSGVFADGAVALDTGPGAGPGAGARIVINGSMLYVRIPMLHELTGEPGWLSMSSNELGDHAADGFRASALDPVALVDTLREVVGDVREVGRELVRGVSTTRVTSTLSSGQGMDVWIEADHLVRRLRFVADDGGVKLGLVATTIELFDYGAPVEIEIPGPDETIAFSDLVHEFLWAGQ